MGQGAVKSGKGVKKKKKEDWVWEKRLLEMWEKAWDAGKTPKCVISYDFFRDLFVEQYKYSCEKKKKNKMRNFGWKIAFIVFIVLVMAGFVVGVILLKIFFAVSQDMWTFLLQSGVLLMALILLCGVIAKWIDVWRYQETWVRYSELLFFLNQEMFFFVNFMGPYGNQHRNEIFMKNIWQLWCENEKRFVSNMMKEKEMMDIFNHLKAKEE